MEVTMYLCQLFLLSAIGLSTTSLSSHTNDFNDPTIFGATNHEPKYANLFYGGIWKHVTVLPQEDDHDVIYAKQAVIFFLENRFSSRDTNISFGNIQCLSKLDLWYTRSSIEPLLMQQMIGKTHKYPVSVPYSLGNTYNFRVQTKNGTLDYWHHLSVTRMLDDQRHFIYAHTYQKDSVNKLSQDQGSLEERNYLSNGFPVSTLSARKDLKIQLMKDPTMPDGQQTQFTIMSYNIWNFFTFSERASYQSRMSNLIKILKSSRPDIICFQEVRLQSQKGGHLGPSQVDHITKHLPEYQFTFQPAMLQDNSFHDGRTEEGVAIFSKYHIVHHEYLLLYRNMSNSADSHQRICLHAVINIPGSGFVHVFNTHWSLHDKAREKSAKQILEYMDHYQAPVMLLGDLNAKPKEKAVKILTSRLTDAWPHLHKDADGSTYNNLKEKPSDRIDFIMFKQNDKLNLDAIEVIADKSGSNAASDHRPVLATFTLNKDPL